MMDAKYEAIKKVWETIPEFKCKDGCHDCCGIIAMTKLEWDNINPKLCGTISMEEHKVIASMFCPYIKVGGCSIYENRPTICRLFGTVNTALLTCPHGCGPAIKMQPEQSRMILHAIDELGG
jgi:hypothetical protein